MAYEYKTYGRTYDLVLGSDGLIHNFELDISGPDLETVKEKIREYAKKIEKAPRIPILTTGSYNVRGDTEYFEGTTTNVTDRHGYRWVSYKDGNGKSQRKKLSGGLFPDTPENRKIFDQIIAINKQIQRLYREASALENTMVTISEYLEAQRDEEPEPV
jgi:hypothetical protein